MAEKSDADWLRSLAFRIERHRLSAKSWGRAPHFSEVDIARLRDIATRCVETGEDRIRALTKDYCKFCGHPHRFHGPGGCTYGHYCECKVFESKS